MLLNSGDGEALRLEMAPGRDFTTPGDLVNLNKGIRMKGEFNILGWGATADITVDLPTKVSVSITTDPLDLGSVLQIYKSSTDQTQGPMLSFDAVLGTSPSATLEYSGYASLMGIVSSDVMVSISNTHMDLSLTNRFAGSTTTFLVSGSYHTNAFDVGFNWRYSLDDMIQAIKDFMNVAGEAMEKAESAVKDASQKVQDAKDKTCKAIGKVW